MVVGGGGYSLWCEASGELSWLEISVWVSNWLSLTELPTPTFPQNKKKQKTLLFPPVGLTNVLLHPFLNKSISPNLAASVSCFYNQSYWWVIQWFLSFMDTRRKRKSKSRCLDKRTASANPVKKEHLWKPLTQKHRYCLFNKFYCFSPHPETKNSRVYKCRLSLNGC